MFGYFYIMGRKSKKGLDYFSLVTKFSDSVKLCAYEAGGISICVLIELWQNIYANHGYYTEFTDDHKILFINSSMAKISSDEFDKILNVFFKRGVFDKEMFEKHQILTSDSVQERYFEACNVSKRTNVLVYSEYLLIHVDEKYKNNLIIQNRLGINEYKLGINTDLLGINTEEIPINSEESAQSKEKKSKVNKNYNNEPNFEKLESTTFIPETKYTEDEVVEKFKNYKDEFLNQSIANDRFCISKRIPLESLESVLNDFNTAKIGEGQTPSKNIAEYRKWVSNWFNKIPEDIKANYRKRKIQVNN